jgi:hypothetical protein
MGPLLGPELVGQVIDVTRKDGIVSKETITAVLKVVRQRPEKKVGRRTFAAVKQSYAICEIVPTRRPFAKFVPTRRESANVCRYREYVEAKAPLTQNTRALLRSVADVHEFPQAAEAAAAERGLTPRFGY